MKRAGAACALVVAGVLLLWHAAAWAQVKNFDAPTRLPPLNSSVVYSRSLATSQFDCVGCTAQLLSLVMDLKNDSSKSALYPWPLYIQLTTNHDRGDATGVNARVYSSGAGWSASLHSESIHSGTGTSIGANIEQSKMSAGGRVIGLNVQATNGYDGVKKNVWSDEAVNIQSVPGSGWKVGLRFNHASLGKGIVFDAETTGKTAIEVGGRFERGVDLSGNSLVLGRGGRIVLDEEENLVLLFNRTARQVEIRAAGELVATFPLAAKAESGGEARPGALH
ncbi:MAG: hypothetical protein NT123_19095 [Proteobacteria bacterium]|nr:hypothetical protein [Pseudomonadota bacterium]